jgi:outer membrane receptor protein involved in Fe transport
MLSPGNATRRGDFNASASALTLALSAAVVSVVLAPEAHAQAAQSAVTSDEAEIADEIIVTAQKREERVFDVPASVSVVTGEEIARRGAATIEDLQYSVPGLSITEFSRGNQRIQLRGISILSGLPTVGVYLNELPLNNELNQAGQDVPALDLERIEVLRGPQGTLFGQGALGGTLRYITATPDLNQFGGHASGEGGAIDGGGTSWRGEGAINLPIVHDAFALRLAGSYENFGGWIDNTSLGAEDVNDGSNLTLRATALWQASNRLQVLLLAQHQDLDLNNLNLADANGDVADRVFSPTRTRVDLADLTVSYDFGGATLLSSTGYLNRRDQAQQDASGGLIPILELPIPFGLGFPPGTFSSVALASESEGRIFTEELRLTSNGDGRLNWTLGAFFRDSSADAVSESVVSPAILPFTLLGTDGTSPSDSRSWAVFGEASYRFVPSLEATIGLRYFEDRRTQDISSTAFGVSATDQGTDTFSSLSPRFNLSWSVSDNANLYFNIAKGFRSGGFNLTSAGLGLVTVPPTYRPETLWSYEVGAKVHSSDRRLTGEIAVYHNNWTDVQSFAFAPGFPIGFTVNGGELSGWGADAQLTFLPIPDLTLQATAGVNDMSYDSNTPEHMAGDPADYVPSFTASASAEYRFDWTPTLPGFARIDYQYADEFQVYLRNTQLTPAFSDTLSYLNARLAINTEGWSASLFARNITNEDGVLHPAFGALSTPARPQPRTIGVAVSMSY